MSQDHRRDALKGLSHPPPEDAEISPYFQNLQAVSTPQNGSHYPRFRAEGDLLYVEEEPEHAPKGHVQETLVALGGGTGAISDNVVVGQSTVLRMRYQGRAALLMLVFVYIATLSVGLTMTYRQAMNNSPVNYYADPRFHSNLVSEAEDLSGFIESFAQPPKTVQLQVTGFVHMPEDIPGGVSWNGQHYHIAFAFALDLSPWVVRLRDVEPFRMHSAAEVAPTSGDRLTSPPEDALFLRQTQPSTQDPPQLIDGVVAEDVECLEFWLVNNENDMAIVELQKEVAWPGWEELATNIKHCIRQRGFDGIVTIRKSESDHVRVYKNRPWANFMYSSTTKALCALSIFGWIFYLPYMWLRRTELPVRAWYRVDMEIRDYWNLIEDQLCAEGFDVQLANRRSRDDSPFASPRNNAASQGVFQQPQDGQSDDVEEEQGD